MSSFMNVSFGDGKFEIIRAEIMNISQNNVFWGKSSEFSRDVDLKIVHHVVAVVINRVYFVNQKTRRFVENNGSSTMIMTQKGIKLN